MNYSDWTFGVSLACAFFFALGALYLFMRGQRQPWTLLTGAGLALLAVARLIPLLAVVANEGDMPMFAFFEGMTSLRFASDVLGLVLLAVGLHVKGLEVAPKPVRPAPKIEPTPVGANRNPRKPRPEPVPEPIEEPEPVPIPVRRRPRRLPPLEPTAAPKTELTTVGGGRSRLESE